MSKIVVFDSGMGSLSIIKPIQKISKYEIIYFADQKNFPYGKKSKSQLKEIIQNRIKLINKKFEPEIIVLGSNTPTLLFKNLIKKNIIGVTPPLKKAEKISKTKNIGILATESVVNSKELLQFIKNEQLSQNTKIFKINASKLVNLVESGNFINNPKKCIDTIQKLLKTIIIKHQIDVITLSSTHLPFLKKYLQKEFPAVKFIDPGNDIAKLVKKKIKTDLTKNKLCIYTSSNTKTFQKQLSKIDIHNKVNFLP